MGKIDVKKFLKERINEKRGKVLNPEGNVVGIHPGIMFFTIGERVGERKGFEISNEYRKKIGNKKLYVAEKKKGNVLIIAPEGHEALKRKKVFIKGFKIINPREKVTGKKFKARIRHLGELHSGKLWKNGARPTRDLARGRIQIHSRNLSPALQLDGKIKKMGTNERRWMFKFNKAVEGVAEGQIIVLHDGERLVCGGEIRLK